jgi:hypothetical protein
MATLAEKRYLSDIDKYALCQCATKSESTILEMVAITGINEVRVKSMLTSLLNNSYMTVENRYTAKSKRNVNYYKVTKAVFRPRSKESYEQEFNTNHSNRALDTSGKYDKLIASNPNLRLITFDRASHPTVRPKRKSSYKGIGSSFAHFDGF